MKRLDFVFRGEGEPEDVRLEGEGGAWRVTRGKRTEEVTAVPMPDGRLSLIFADGRQVCGRAVPGEAGEISVTTREGRRLVRLADPLHDRLSHAQTAGSDAGDEEVRALMPGRVLELRASRGARVEAGDVLVVLEAMKMQNEIRASGGGIIERCEVSAGDAVEGRALLLVIRRAPKD